MKKLVVFIFLSFLAVGCVKDESLESDDKPVVVVNCVLNNSDTQILNLSYSKKNSQDHNEKIKEASARLYITVNGMKQKIGEFEKKEDGKWILDYTPETSRKYELEINVPGYETISAVDTMPESTNIYAMPIRKDFIGSIEEMSSSYSSERCGYALDGPNWNVLYIYALNYNPETKCREIAEEICTNSKDADDLCKIEDKMYYEEERDSVNFLGWKYTGGFFLELNGCAYHDKLLHFPINRTRPNVSVSPDERAVRDVYCITGSFTEPFYSFKNYRKRAPNDTESVIVATTVSNTYEKILREMDAYGELYKSDDMSSIYVRDNVYTNVRNGLGIFAACNHKYLPWTKSFDGEHIEDIQM